MAVNSTSVPTEGNYLVKWLPAIAGLLGPTLSEFNAAGAKDLTGYFTPDGWTPAGDQATVTDDRLTSPQTYEQPGKVSDTLDTIYVTNPPVPTDDVAALTLLQGAAGFIVARKAIDRDVVAAAGQKLTIWPIRCGVQRGLAPEANGVFKIGQKQFVTNAVRREVAILA